MKRRIAPLPAAILCLLLAACTRAPEKGTPEIQTDPGKASREVLQQSGHSSHSGTTTKPEAAAQQTVELVGPWHLDSEKNDLAGFPDRFPGYAEWGASMQLLSSGEMNWYIGAEGWHGTYETDNKTIHAQLDSDLEQVTLPWDFRIVTDSEPAMLEMDYEEMTVYWIYGNQEDAAYETGNE